MWAFLYRMASPKTFFYTSEKLIPWFRAIGLILFSYGLVGGLYFAPSDYQQGDAFRIIYLHVPSAIMSLAVYTLMAFCACLTLVWKIKLADVIAKVSAPLGACFTFLALVTGSIWGKPMWGTWWIWDARLTSELILLFLYFATIALRSAITDRQKASQIVSIFVLIGFVDIPIIHYSVAWWNTLHQGATLTKFSLPSIAPSMLYPLLAMILAFVAYFIVQLLQRARFQVLYDERRTTWVIEQSEAFQ